MDAFANHALFAVNPCSASSTRKTNAITARAARPAAGVSPIDRCRSCCTTASRDRSTKTSRRANASRWRGLSPEERHRFASAVAERNPSRLRASLELRADRVLTVRQSREKDRSLRSAIHDDAAGRVKNLQVNISDELGALPGAASREHELERVLACLGAKLVGFVGSDAAIHIRDMS